MSKNIFITATGTDVGKTYVSALIVKEMRKAGYNCGYFKPVLSGIEEQTQIMLLIPQKSLVKRTIVSDTGGRRQFLHI